jgi:hypothetical protein
MSNSKLKTKLALLLTACCALLPAVGNADYYFASDPRCPEVCPPCDPCPRWFSGIEVGADFIYWKPCINDLDYAITFTSDPSGAPVTAYGQYKLLNHCYEPGFRVHAAKSNVWCGWDISASYTWIWSKDSDSTIPPLPDGMVFSTLNNGALNLQAGSITLIDASHSVRYQSFDVLFHHEYNCFGPCNLLIPYWGIEGIKIDQEIHSETVGAFLQELATFNVDWDSEVLALGLKLGTEYQYTIKPCLKWFTNASFSIVAGNNDTTNRQIRTVDSTVPLDADIKFKDCSGICIPGCHLMTGLSYEQDFCGMLLRARIGYEFLEWWNVPKIRRYFSADLDDIGVSTASLGSSLGFHGLFVGLDVGF